MFSMCVEPALHAREHGLRLKPLQDLTQLPHRCPTKGSKLDGEYGEGSILDGREPGCALELTLPDGKWIAQQEPIVLKNYDSRSVKRWIDRSHAQYRREPDATEWASQKTLRRQNL